MKYKEEWEAYRLYDECLDEQGDIVIGTLTYRPSMVLKEVDPTAYRCGFVDWCDSMDITTDPDELGEEDNKEDLP